MQEVSTGSIRSSLRGIAWQRRIQSCAPAYAVIQIDNKTMRREDIVLAAMAAGGERACYDPVRIQKLLFVINREVPIEGGQHFEFRAGHCGPFDGAVYDSLDQLAAAEKVVVNRIGQYMEYSLSGIGHKQGKAVLRQLPRRTSRAITKYSRWVQSLYFWDLIAAFYRLYPEMAVNSRIPEVALRNVQRKKLRPKHPFLSGIFSGFEIWPGEEDPDAGMPLAERAALAIARDWRVVGDGLRSAIAQVSRNAAH